MQAKYFGTMPNRLFTSNFVCFKGPNMLLNIDKLVLKQGGFKLSVGRFLGNMLAGKALTVQLDAVRDVYELLKLDFYYIGFLGSNLNLFQLIQGQMTPFLSISAGNEVKKLHKS